MSAGQELHTLEQWKAGTAARAAGSSEIGHKDTFKLEITIKKENADELWVTMSTKPLFSLNAKTTVL